ncbi:hypothetical protein NOCARDAX2BIS_210062 [Nocardioides sp. AX2bis]|nr:hypothetical protein NOCARDAX2BIS_210062 [Nocardioides sp. AX2bis]
MAADPDARVPGRCGGLGGRGVRRRAVRGRALLAPAPPGARAGGHRPAAATGGDHPRPLRPPGARAGVRRRRGRRRRRGPPGGRGVSEAPPVVEERAQPGGRGASAAPPVVEE